MRNSIYGNDLKTQGSEVLLCIFTFFLFACLFEYITGLLENEQLTIHAQEVGTNKI